jgi:DNA polymerase-3 subunit beta
MAAQELIPVMRRAKTCTADDELRPVMNSVCLDCFIDKMVVVSTNGHVMMKYVLETPGYMQQVGFPVTESACLLIPKQAMPSVVAAFSGADRLTVSADTQRIQLSTDGVTLVTRCIEGRYPNYESVIPKDSPYRVQMSRDTLKMALRRIQLSANSSSNMATFRADAGAFVISADDYEFSREGSERVPVQQTDAFLPDGFTIGMKIQNTLELLDLLDEDNICLYFSTPSQAFLLKNESPKAQNVTLLQMPMVVNGEGAAE